MTVVLILAVGTVSDAFGQIAGGYGDADPKDKDVIKAAEFATKKLGTDEMSKISVVRIEKARLQVVAGLNYELCMEVTVKRGSKKASKRYLKAVVYKDLKNRYSLSNWTISTDELKCGD